MLSENVYESTVEVELQRFNSIVEKHALELDTIKEILEPYDLPPWIPGKDIIDLKLEPFEYVSDFDIIHSNNLLLSKTVLVLTTLCKEMASLVDEAEKDFYIPIAIYGSPGNINNGPQKSPNFCFSQILPLLDKINCYTHHAKKVIWNITLQMNALHSSEKVAYSVHAGSAHFQVVFEHLGRVLGTLIILDELIAENKKLQSHFALYKKLVKSSLTEPSSVSSTKKDLENLMTFINDLDKNILAASIFKNVLDEISQKAILDVAKNGCLREEISTVILGWSAQIEDISSSGWWYEYKAQVLAVTALAIFYQIVFDVQDRKVARELINLYKKVPCFLVAVNHVWLGEKYLERHFPSLHCLFERRNLDSLSLQRKNYLANKIHSIANEVQVMALKVLGWSVQMEGATRKPASLLSKQDLDHRALLLWQGLIWASNLKFTAESVLGLHTAIGQPMSRSCVVSFCRVLELLKAIEHTYYHNTSMLAETLPHLRQYLSYQLLNLLKTTRTRAEKEKLNDSVVDMLSALTIAEQALAGNGNRNRLLIARVSLSLTTQSKIMLEEDLSFILVALRRLSIASDIQGKVRRVTSAEFLYQHSVIFQMYLRDYLDNARFSVHRIHYLLAAVNDSKNVLQTPENLPDRDLMLKSLKKEAEDCLKREFLDKVCKLVETDLRLKSHSHLHSNKQSPFDTPPNQIYSIIHLRPLNLFGSVICVKDYVEQYLERTFYNLTVVAPYDCNTYEFMRSIARSAFGLITVNSHLPSQTIEQGVDVLEIMRNINVFVQCYQYNLNQQFFVEIESNNKHLNTVSIKHIANSIRVHGTGIINTTVNFTYQFLRKKFHILSQFLYDEHIKSRLLKDLQYWKGVKEMEKSFTYERANKFHRGIRKLGLSSGGLSYLDQFRKLVTHIGNAIGYIRLVRSGCLHSISSATQFIPDFESVTQFEHLCREDLVHQRTLDAANNLAAVLDNLTAHFHKETDYFKIMVSVFAPVLRDPKNGHLRNFYLIVPALTINFIEYFISARENLSKKNRKDSAFTDDGFAVGVAYILKVLDQIEAFNSLHWWSGVRRKFIAEKERVETESGKSNDGDSKLQQTLSLTLRRLQEHQVAFDYLFLSVSSAQVFFKELEIEKVKEDTNCSHQGALGRDP